MARPKKAAATAAEQRVVKKGEVVLNEQQIQELRDILEGLSESRRLSDDLGTDRGDDMKEIGFTIGKIYSTLDRIEDKLDDLLDAVAPISYDFELDEDDDN